MDNSRGSVFTSWATFYGLIHKIVTKAEILALVSLPLGTYFRRYCPMIGYMAKWWIISKCHFVFIWLQSMLLSIKLWPELKFWHRSLCCQAPISNDIDLSLVTRQPIFRTRKSFIEFKFSPNGSLSATTRSCLKNHQLLWADGRREVGDPPFRSEDGGRCWPLKYIIWRKPWTFHCNLGGGLGRGWDFDWNIFKFTYCTVQRRSGRKLNGEEKNVKKKLIKV